MKKTKQGMTDAEENQLRTNPINVFRCGVCKDAEDMPFKEFQKHLFEVHKLNKDHLSGKKQMMMHIDYAQSFSSTYECTLESGLKFHQYCEKMRY